MNDEVKSVVAEAIRDFAKALIDKSTGGVIAAIDVVDLNAEYQRRLKGK